MSPWLLLLLSYPWVKQCSGYRILVVFPLASRSHSILGDGVVSALAKAGHEITYITPYPKGKGQSNVREIDLSENQKILPENISDIKNFLSKESSGMNYTLFVDALIKSCVSTIENKEVQKMMYDPKEKFDVVVMEWVFIELLAGLSAVFNAPYIWLSSSEPHPFILRLVDDVPSPAVDPDMMSGNMPPLTFFQRVQEMALAVAGVVWHYFTMNSMQHREYERLFAGPIKARGNVMPPLDDLKLNASLVLSNSHASIGKSIPLPQNFKPIGGYHISRDVKPLPENLKKILDGAKNGLIYFSMGSNVKSKFMPEELKQSLLRMFSELKYTVIWKFEEDHPGTPKNVHIVQWAPQQSILAHPNCILFITHGGQLSTTETVHFGKPIVAIPVLADQLLNAQRAVKLGFAKKIDLSINMAGDIKKAIEDILGDPKYSARARELSQMYHDRPLTPDKELVHWVEHVVKTGGAAYLRSPALGVPVYQKMYLDLVALVVGVLVIVIALLKRMVSFFRRNKKVEKKKKH